MAYQMRRDRKGTEYFSFTYVDPQTRSKVRIPKRKTFHIRTVSEAETFQRKLDAEHDAVKLRIERKLDWRRKYYDLAEMVSEFESYRTQVAPNSWRNSILYLEQYIIPFFIAQTNGNNINLWSERYEAFRDHLMKVERAKFGGPLAYNTRNHIITTLNSFLEWAADRKKCEKQDKMRLFPDHLMRSRSVEDIYSDEEFDKVYAALKEKSQDEADLFVVLRHTGLRLNEALGLSLDDFILGEPDRFEFQKLLKDVGIRCRAFIFLQSQPALKEIRSPNGKVLRKDLKHKNKKRKEEKFRIIPIPEIKRELYNILARRMNNQKSLYKEKVYGNDRSDYLLFDGINRATFDRHLREVCIENNLPVKSSHCLRHTYATELSGISNSNTRFARMVLGHTRQETTDRYDHLFGLLNKAATTQKQIAIEEDLPLLA